MAFGTCPEIEQVQMAFGRIYKEAMLWQVNFSWVPGRTLRPTAVRPVRRVIRIAPTGGKEFLCYPHLVSPFWPPQRW